MDKRSDPGKRVDAHLTTAEWKAFRVAAKARGLTVGLAARLAIQDWTSMDVDRAKEP